MKTGDSALLDAVFSQLCRWIDNCEQQVEIFLKNGLTISSTSSNAMAQAFGMLKFLLRKIEIIQLKQKKNRSMENKFNKKKKYKNLCMIFSPNGIIKEGTILTGEQWINALVFEVGNGFEQMFEMVS